MLEKLFRGLISDEQLLARRNSAALLDALEALDKLKPGNWSVSKLHLHPDTRHDWSKGIKYYRTGLSQDDSLKTNEWYLFFLVQKPASKHDSAVSSEVTYCGTSEIAPMVYSNFVRLLRENRQSSRFAVGDGVRFLFARFNPSRGRHSSKDLYEDMHCALRSMSERLCAPMCDEDLADFVNEKNNTIRPRYYGTPLSEESLEEMLSRGTPRSGWRNTNLKFEASDAVKNWR
jgi:hypothetical protein